MARAARSLLLAALALIWCCSGGVSAGSQHFIERMLQSARQEAQRRTRCPDSSQTSRVHVPLPNSLQAALSKAMSYEPRRSRRPSGGCHERRRRPSTRPEHGGGAENSSSGGSAETRDSSHRHLNITETLAGCNCSGVPAVSGRTLSFLISELPPLESALLSLHLVIASEPGSERPAGATTLATRLTLCAPGGVGRSLDASLLLKPVRHRPNWRHAFVGGSVAPLRRRSAEEAEAGAGAEAGAEEADQAQCLEVMLPADGAVALDRHPHRSAHLVFRPQRSRRS